MPEVDNIPKKYLINFQIEIPNTNISIINKNELMMNYKTACGLIFRITA
jgi:hypothetical protein